MKARFNEHEDRIIYLTPENERERVVLRNMWKNGVVSATFSTGGDELGICDKDFFGSGSRSSDKPHVRPKIPKKWKPGQLRTGHSRTSDVTGDKNE